jgi:hypothetical protein
MVKGDGLCSSKPEFRGISLIVESPTTQSKFDGSISLKFHTGILLFPLLNQRSQTDGKGSD